MKKILLFFLLLSSYAAAQPVLSPTGGAYAGTQNVLITPPAGTGQKCFYTIDGSTPSIAGFPAPVPPATLAISSTKTLNVICARIGVVSQGSNLDPNTGSGHWQCDVTTGTTFPSGVTCKTGGGITGQPINVQWTPGNNPMTQTMTSGAGTGSVQMLFTHGTPTTACPNCTWLVQDKIIQVDKGKTIIENNELDLNVNMQTTWAQFHTASLQCNQQGATPQWQVGPQCFGTAGCGWFNTGITYGCPISTTQQTEVRYGIHWTNGDTSCSWTKAGVTHNVSCDSYDFLNICVGGSVGTGGVCKNFTLNQIHPGDPGKGTGWGDQMIQQDQPDGVPSANPFTATRSVWNNNATLAYFGTDTNVSATYTIGPLLPIPPMRLGGGLQLGGKLKVQ